MGVAAVASAQQAATSQAAVVRPYDGIQAGLDAFRLAEEQRQVGVAQQLSLNDQMRFWNGYPTSRGATIYYGYLSPAAAAAYPYAGMPNAYAGAPYGYPASLYGYAGPLLTRANLDYTYAYGAGPLWGGYGSGGYPLSVFQPWPYLPGDIYGYGAYYAPARQPIGQQQLQTGPNRWESHPVYDPPLTNYQPLPPVDSPLLDRTPYSTLPTATAPANGVPPEPPRPTNPTVTDAVPPPPPPALPPAAPRRGPREY
jgi:hypothetical protein